jgi:hypothetical protein
MGRGKAIYFNAITMFDGCEWVLGKRREVFWWKGQEKEKVLIKNRWQM